MKKTARDNRFSWVLWGFFYFFVFSLLLKGSFGYLDPDFGWHLKVGEEIAVTGSVPDVNSFNYTYTGSWVDHEWLSNYLSYEVYSNFGYIALSVLFALLIVGVLMILHLWVRRALPQASPFLIAFFQLGGVVAASPHFGIRMQESGVLFLTLILLIIYHYNKQRNWKILLLFTPLMYLWACLHGSFLIGFAVFGAWIGVRVLEKILHQYYHRSWIDLSRVFKGRDIWVFSGTALLAAAATILTPYKLGLYSFLTGYKDNFYAWHIQEWLPQSNYPFQYWQLAYLALVLIALTFYLYLSRGQKRLWRLDLWALLLTVFFVFLSFKSRRHFPLMFVATFIFVIQVFSRSFQIGSKPNPEKSWLQRNWLSWYLLICLLMASLAQLIATDFTARPFASFRRDYPVGAVEFLKARPQYRDERLFNDYGWGGYLIWTMPERRLFIDGRLPQVEYRGRTFLEEYLDFFQEKADASKRLSEYDVNLVLIPAKDAKIKAARWEQILFGIGNQDLTSHNYLRDHLNYSGEWQPIYYDKTAIIYERIK